MPTCGERWRAGQRTIGVRLRPYGPAHLLLRSLDLDISPESSSLLGRQLQAAHDRLLASVRHGVLDALPTLSFIVATFLDNGIAILVKLNVGRVVAVVRVDARFGDFFFDVAGCRGWRRRRQRVKGLFTNTEDV